MIKLNAGFSRKVGEPSFSSRGASVNLELELESSLVSDPDKMQEKIRALRGRRKNLWTGAPSPVSSLTERSAQMIKLNAGFSRKVGDAARCALTTPACLPASQQPITN